MYDAVQYMYQQPYVLKDANGNGIIGVTGHSMGGFSTTVALAFDAMAAAETGVLQIYTGITEGADFSYSAFIGVDAAASAAAGAGRTLGRVAAQYDEFFFNDPNEAGGTVRHKNFVATPDGQTWLEQAAPEANTWYNTSDGGKRIIYQPAETHPWNHFSKTTTGHILDFYTEAFSDYDHMLTDIPSNDQIWLWKEISECVALIGFVMFIIAAANIILVLPFFRKAKSGACSRRRRQDCKSVDYCCSNPAARNFLHASDGSGRRHTHCQHSGLRRYHCRTGWSVLCSC